MGGGSRRRARLDEVTLTGGHVRLEPLGHHHVDDLVAAASGDRSTFAFTTVPSGRDAMDRYVAELLAARAAGEVVPFAQCLPDGTAVGCTRFMSLRWWRGRDAPDEVEIGGTWLAPTIQRTPVNTEAKFLLLRHAFEEWGVWRVDLVTDARNERSRAAIVRLGARFEGVLHRHRLAADAPPDALGPRDSAVHAVTDEDWPAVSAGLRRRLGECD